MTLMGEVKVIHAAKNTKSWWSKKAKPATPSLFTTANDNDIEKLKELANKEINIQTILDERKNTPLHYAAYVGAYEAVVTLVGYVTEVDDANEDGYTPFLFAVWSGHCNICKFLLDKRANLHHLTCSQDHAIHIAARDEHCTVVDLLISRNCDLETIRTKTGKTALHCACSTPNNMQMLQLLLMWCTSLVFIKDIYGNSPLHVAVQAQSVNMVRLLLMKQASPNCENSYGTTPLIMARRNPSMRSMVGVFGCADMLTKLQNLSQVEAKDHLREIGRTASPRSRRVIIGSRPGSPLPPRKTLTRFASSPALLSYRRSSTKPLTLASVLDRRAMLEPMGAPVEDVRDTLEDGGLSAPEDGMSPTRSSVSFSRRRTNLQVYTSSPERRAKMACFVPADGFFGEIGDLLPATDNRPLSQSSTRRSPTRRSPAERTTRAGAYPAHFPRAGGGFLASNPLGVGFLSSVEIPVQCISTRHDMRRRRLTAHMKRAMQTHDLVNSVENAETREQIRAFQILAEMETQFFEEFTMQTQHKEKLELFARGIAEDAVSDSRASFLASALNDAHASAQRAKNNLHTARKEMTYTVESQELRELCGVDFLWDEVEVPHAEKIRSPSSPLSQRGLGSPGVSPCRRHPVATHPLRAELIPTRIMS
eukprot:GEMP01005573.1.p1 GENE.GEMP01005573.1~~GEMP01005573.1.p1  ORF type:complete len:702 (+),score=137.77 GEMP01005573.1:161-2107(+)